MLYAVRFTVGCAAAKLVLIIERSSLREHAYITPSQGCARGG